MPKLTVYVETSVWSCAFAEDVPDYRRDTVAFLDRCREGCFDVSISPLVLDEIDRAPESLRSRLIHLIEEIKPSVLDPTASVDELVTAFMTSKVVPPRSLSE